MQDFWESIYFKNEKLPYYYIFYVFVGFSRTRVFGRWSWNENNRVMEPLPGIALNYRRTSQNCEAALKFRRKPEHPFCSVNVRDKPTKWDDGSDCVQVALAKFRIASSHAAPQKTGTKFRFCSGVTEAFSEENLLMESGLVFLGTVGFPDLCQSVAIP